MLLKLSPNIVVGVKGVLLHPRTWGGVGVERRGGWALEASSSLAEVEARSGRLVRPQVSWAVVEAAEVQQGQPESFLRARYARISQHRRVEEVRCT